MLRLPVDFERLPEYRMLAQALADGLAGHREAGATHLVLRLWVELAYSAQVTNQAGLLPAGAAMLYEQSVAPVCKDALEVMRRTSWLEVAEGGFLCKRFAQLNPHLAGNYKSRELRGAASSALARNKNHIAHEAMSQAMLLPPDIFKKPDGTKMGDSEVNRCMVLIRTIDNCLKAPGRNKRDFSEGLIADASAVAETMNAEDLREFYVWLQLNRDHPAMPKTTEQVLARWDEMQAMSKAN